MENLENTSPGTEKTRWLSTSQAATTFGVSSASLYRLARQNLIPHIRVGRAIRFNLTELEKVFSCSPSVEK